MPKTSSHRTGRVKYAAEPLDRAAERREDTEWLERARADPRAQVLPVWRDRNLVDGTEHGAPAGVRNGLISVRAEVVDLVFLGLEQGTPLFAADLSHLERDAAERMVAGTFTDLRRVGPLLADADAALLAYARGIVYWHRSHRHCGRCGSPTLSSKGGHLRVCRDPGCGHAVFPRTDPAIIVLVEHPGGDDGPPRCLLGRPARFPPGMYSTLAGFVEPGESLEATVRREVYEESGVEVDKVEYLASQPWPFPSSLMVGFHARARTEAISRRDHELEDARWFSAEELRLAGEWGDETPLCLPRRDSIARFLIERWLSRCG